MATDLSKWDSDQTLYLFTSLTAGSSHIITATSRMETILKANRIPFTYIDTATNEEARKLFQRRAAGKKLPLLVKEGYVLGDITEVEELNEFGRQRRDLARTGLAPPLIRLPSLSSHPLHRCPTLQPLRLLATNWQVSRTTKYTADRPFLRPRRETSKRLKKRPRYPRTTNTNPRTFPRRHQVRSHRWHLRRAHQLHMMTKLWARPLSSLLAQPWQTLRRTCSENSSEESRTRQLRTNPRPKVQQHQEPPRMQMILQTSRRQRRSQRRANRKRRTTARRMP
ncbi:hypothetical protein IWX49DRAFT_300286 [Phyllosticta citricarpa]|uniref:Glutaredoxin domain-containing protein n=1 Tax=Phyllosticta citricarpa TaxID=55181 RepID=A0ABR1LGU2_9PEZI